jgi:hypothetical protein
MRRGPLNGTLLVLFCLNHLGKAHRCHSVQALTLDPFCSKALISWFCFTFQIVWIEEFTRHNSRHRSAFFYPFSICCITATFPSTLKNSFLFMTVAMLCYQSPVDSRGREVEGNFTHKVNYRYYCHFPGLEFM